MPWARAARMVEQWPAQGVTASDEPHPQPAEATPAGHQPRPSLTLLSSDKVDARSRRATYWAARTTSSRRPSTPVAEPAAPTPGPRAAAADPGESPSAVADSPVEPPDSRATPAALRVASIDPSADVIGPAAEPAELVDAPTETADPRPAAAAPPAERTADRADASVGGRAEAASVAVRSTVVSPRAAAPPAPSDAVAIPAAVVDPTPAHAVAPAVAVTGRAGTHVDGAERGTPDPPQAPPADVTPAPRVSEAARDTAAQPSGLSIDITPAPLPTNGHSPTPTPGRVAGRVRRPPSATPAEQAAADLALLRTFGVAGRTGTADEPEVALEGCTPDDDEPVAGNAQPIAFRVLARNGRGIHGATVTLLDDHGRETASTHTRSDGHGVLTARHPGGYMLVAAADGYQPGAITVAVTDAPVDAEIPLTRSASIAGSVGGEDGPIVGARLALVQDGEIVDTTESAADGAYRFADLAAGEYGLSVTAHDCEAAAFVLVLADEVDLRQDVDLVPAGLPSDDVMSAPR